MQTIDTILFDFGGVINTWIDPAAAAARHQVLASQIGFEDVSEMFSRFFAEDEWKRARIGEITEAEMWAEILSPLGLADRAERERFLFQVFGLEGVLPEMVTLIERLHGRYQLAMLSNASDTLEEKMAGMGVARFFDPIVNSHRIGAAKPDAAAYEITLERLNVTAEQVYFIDDRERNTLAAEEMGFRCHLFTDIASLRADLHRLELI